MVNRSLKDSTRAEATNTRTGLTLAIAILVLICGLAYQQSPQVVIVQATTKQSHE
jgi:hypothetical protein